MERQRQNFPLFSNHIVTGEKKGQRCLWVKDKSVHESKSIRDRGWMRVGVTSWGAWILSVRTLFCTSIKTIWCLNLTDSIRDVAETVSWNQCRLRLRFCSTLNVTDCQWYLVMQDPVNSLFIISVKSCCTVHFIKCCLCCITYKAICLVKFS